MMDYAQFLESKAPMALKRGIKASNLSSHLFGFQKHCVEYLLECGSGGLFLDTGLGKTLVQLPIDALVFERGIRLPRARLPRGRRPRRRLAR